MKISVTLSSRGSEFVANCPELDINCYGSSRNDAVRRMQAIISFYMESARDFGADVETMTEMVIDGAAVDFRAQKICPPTCSVN